MNRFEHADAHRAPGAGRARARADRASSGSRRRRRCSATRSASTATTPWWSYIPHFTGSPGYVYAYAYGYLFSLAIYRQYVQEGDAMVEPYLELLRAGGSRSPEELAELVGLDLTDPAIWASGIDALAEELDEAERLAAEIGLGTD